MKGKQPWCKPQETSTERTAVISCYMPVIKWLWILEYFIGLFWNDRWYHKQNSILYVLVVTCIVRKKILFQFYFEKYFNSIHFFCKLNMFRRWLTLYINQPQNLALLTLGTIMFKLIENLVVDELFVCNLPMRLGKK